MRGPDEDTLAGDLQARLDAVFGQPLVEVATLRRQGSAPYRAAPDGSRQVIVYFNAGLRFVAAYDPSDWESLSPALIANALGATDRGIFGLAPGRHEPGAAFRSHGSLVYRKAGDDWVPSDERLLATAVDAGGPPSGTPGADELVQRLAKIVMQSPTTRGADREIITEEIDRALRNITLRLQREHEGVAVAAGPAGGEYWRFLTSVTQGLPESAGIQVVATEGSVANAFLIQSQRARIGVMQSDVAAAAVTGQGVFAETGPLSHLRAVASLFPEPVHIVVRADSDIVQVADLAGRRVALGSPQSGSRHTALRLLAYAGIDPAGLEPVEYGSPADALARLAAGELDAVIEVASAPWQQLEAALRHHAIATDRFRHRTGGAPRRGPARAVAAGHSRTHLRWARPRPCRRSRRRRCWWRTATSRRSRSRRCSSTCTQRRRARRGARGAPFEGARTVRHYDPDARGRTAFLCANGGRAGHCRESMSQAPRPARGAPSSSGASGTS